MDVGGLSASGRRATLVLAFALGLGDSVALAFEHHLALELSHRAEDVQHEPPIGRGSVQPHAEDAQ